MMLKTGIYVDSLNIQMNGGYGIRYDTLYRYAERNGTVIRADAYLCEDRDRKKDDPEYRANITTYHKRLRASGFKVIVSAIAKYVERDETFIKANVDMDIALDILHQARYLDRIILLTGDGDFTRLVETVQNYGTRVELIAFQNVSTRLAAMADVYTNGFIIPGLLPCERQRGYSVRYNSDKGFGFLRYFSDDMKPSDIFFHISEVDRQEVFDSDRLTPIFEFTPSEDENGKPRAVDLKVVTQDGNM